MGANMTRELTGRRIRDYRATLEAMAEGAESAARRCESRLKSEWGEGYAAGIRWALERFGAALEDEVA